MFKLIDTILIRPLRDKTYNQKQIVLDDEANKGKDPVKDEMETKTVNNKVAFEIQKAVVEHIPVEIVVPYSEGETI